MSAFRHRDDESSSTGTVLGVLLGAAAGFAIGMFVAQRVGGVDGLRRKLGRRRAGVSTDGNQAAALEATDVDEFEDVEADDLESDSFDEVLEDRVLEVFRNDPILSERAIDIGSIGDGVIELAGWVETEDESHHAVTIARGVPDVDTVVNRIAIGDEERRFDEAARRVKAGDPSLTETHWEGGGVGTGRRRQGTSSEFDRHATPKPVLEERWQRADEALRNAADDTDDTAERRGNGSRSARGDRAGIVPQIDHVETPVEGDRA